MRILTPYAGKERPARTPPKPPALPPKVPTATAQRAPGAKLPAQAAAAGGHQMPDQAAAHPQSSAAPPTKPVNADKERRKQDEKSKVHPACLCSEVNSLYDREMYLCCELCRPHCGCMSQASARGPIELRWGHVQLICMSAHVWPEGAGATITCVAEKVAICCITG